MTNLETRADRAVRDAVDAFMDGRLVPDFSGETIFETKNSRYRLHGGVVFAAPDPSLVGAELVGWLCESPRRCLVESAWQHGARAVLVDRSRGRNIIVTSTTRLLHVEEPGPTSFPSSPALPAPREPFRSWHPPEETAHVPEPEEDPAEPTVITTDPPAAPEPGPPTLFSQHAPIIASTPPPPLVAEALGLAPAPRTASVPAPPKRAASDLPPPPKRTIPPPVAIPPPSPFMSGAMSAVSTPVEGAKRLGVHMPPRPIVPRARPSPRPLPAPVPPPRRDSPPPALLVPAAPAMPAEAPTWELTSAELEIVEAPSSEPLSTEPLTAPRLQADADALCQAEDDIPFDLSRPITVSPHADAIDNEPVNSEPFPLVRSTRRP